MNDEDDDKTAVRGHFRGARAPDHLVKAPGAPFAYWRTIAVRGAGFPVTDVLALRATRSSARANSVIDAEAELEEAKQHVFDAIARVRDREGLESSGPSMSGPTPTSTRPRWRHLRRLVSQGKSIATEDVAIEDVAAEDVAAEDVATEGASRSLAERLEQYRVSRERLIQMRGLFSESFDRDMEAIRSKLRATAGEPRFREATIWQSRDALHLGMDRYLANPSSAMNQKAQVREELIANYLQRYCTKNDSIGFFGPIGWASWTDDGPAISLRTGSGLIAWREVFFEGWCINALANAIGSRAAYRPWLAPRRHPTVHVHGNELHLPGQAVSRLDDAQAAVLAACDGQQTASRIARTLINEAGILSSEQQVFDMLEDFVARGWITWKLEVSWSPHPERALRRRLESIEESGLRAQALAMLDAMEAARGEILHAAGDPKSLDRAMQELESLFARFTGIEATRGGGEFYAGRSIVYQDCRRDIELTFGPELLQRLRPMTLLLHSARWYTRETRKNCVRAFDALYAQMGGSDASTVDASSFMLAAQAKIREAVGDAQAELRARWLDIFELPEGPSRVQYHDDILRPRVLETFRTEGPAWQLARHASPDILIAARDEQAISRGEYQIVIGELHLARNSLDQSAFFTVHPDPENLIDWMTHDLSEPILLPAYPTDWTNKTWSIFGQRGNMMVTPRHAEFFAFAPSMPCTPPARTTGIGSFVVAREGGELWLRARDGRTRYELVDALGAALTRAIVQTFQILPPMRHRPRITIDDVIVQREAWSLRPDEFDFVDVKNPQERFLRARRWARERALPACVFVKANVELKPFYVDLESPTFIDSLARVVRRCQSSESAESYITISEMLPSPEQSWLRDGEGTRYTCELRMVTVDLS